jgi:hypothetical protein
MNMEERMKQFLVVMGIVMLMVGFSSCDMNIDDEDEDDTRIIEDEEEVVGELPAFTTLAGTAWLWGQSLLEFDETHVVFRGDATKHYTYTVSALVDGEEGSGTITTLGDFTLNAERDTLEIVNYRNNSGSGANMMDVADNERRGHSNKPFYNAVFTRKNPDTMVVPTASTMVGTEWNVGGDGTRFSAGQYIIFFTEDECVNQSGNYLFVNFYTFDKTKGSGWIEYITNGDTNFSINPAWSSMYIPSYKQYPHSMDCGRVR